MSKFNNECEYICVPAEFVGGHLKNANGAYVKVYLYILALAAKGRDMSFGEIAAELNLIESDVLNAIEYWKKDGILEENGGEIVIVNKKSAATAQKSAAPIKKEGIKPDYDSKFVAKLIADTPALSDMMGLAQEIFGRILTKSEMESVFWFYDGLKFSPEAILLLLEYCVSKGKTSMKYIEKVALAWSESGAKEADSVYEIIQNEKQKNGYLYAVRKVLGIADRALSQSEEKYLMKWKNECGMSEEMVVHAYDCCITQIAKLSFPYMDKIIERWHKEGIHDVAAAESDSKSFKERKSADSTGEYNDLENLTRGRMGK